MAAWDLKEPQVLTQARLMAGTPEFVFEQLKFYGENVEGWSGGKGDLEKLLLTRQDKLIDLALAQFATDKAVISDLYKKASAKPEVWEKTDFYHRGLRTACLSNRHLDFFNWPDFDLPA